MIELTFIACKRKTLPLSEADVIVVDGHKSEGEGQRIAWKAGLANQKLRESEMPMVEWLAEYEVLVDARTLETFITIE